MDEKVNVRTLPISFQCSAQAGAVYHRTGALFNMAAAAIGFDNAISLMMSRLLNIFLAKHGPRLTLEMLDGYKKTVDTVYAQNEQARRDRTGATVN
jgi:hypothetical protein